MSAVILLRDDPERLLTLGEASALLEVADMHLGRDIRAGILQARVGVRGGRVARLIRAGDLASMDPRVLDRQLPALLEPGVGVSSALSPLSGIDVLDGMLAGPGLCADPPESVLPDNGPGPGAQVSPAPPAEDTGSLRLQLEESQRRSEQLLALLEEEHSRSVSELRVERASHARALQGLLPQRRLQAGLVLGLVLAGVFYLRSRHLGLPAFGGVAIAASERAGGGVPAGELDSEFKGGARPGAAPAQAGAWSGGQPQGSSGSLALPSGVASSGSEQAEVLHPGSPPPGTSLLSALPEPELMGLPQALDGEPPCDFYPVTQPGMELRGLLGPCAGAWSPAHNSVVGYYRRDGAAYCRHHHFFVSRLQGSVERARQVADLAVLDGLLPPLVCLRVERAGAFFLRRRVGDWIESGFEAAPAGCDEHQIEAGPGADSWIVRSWVRFHDVGGLEHREAFTMSLQLGDGAEGDKLIQFEWVVPVR